MLWVAVSRRVPRSSGWRTHRTWLPTLPDVLLETQECYGVVIDDVAFLCQKRRLAAIASDPTPTSAACPDPLGNHVAAERIPGILDKDPQLRVTDEHVFQQQRVAGGNSEAPGRYGPNPAV
jgi:hypothetical protein